MQPMILKIKRKQYIKFTVKTLTLNRQLYAYFTFLSYWDYSGDHFPSHRTCNWLFNARFRHGYMNTKLETGMSKNIQLVGARVSHHNVWVSTY